MAKDEGDPAHPQTECRQGWIEQHFDTAGAPDGHGFAPATSPTGYGRPPVADLNDDGYYSWSPVQGFRFIVMDTIADDCPGNTVCAEGNVDDAQFQWVEGQLNAAENLGEYVVLFSHHTLGTTRFPSNDVSEQPLHYGTDAANPSGEQTLEELYCGHQPTVLAHVNGHEHAPFIEEHPCSGLSTPGPGEFWEISTAAHIDYPQQSRMIEVVDNRDGTMSLITTIIDHDGPANVAANSLGDGGTVEELASISREVAFNDPQGDPTAGGEAADRNVVIHFDRAPPAGPPPPNATIHDALSTSVVGRLHAPGRRLRPGR